MPLKCVVHRHWRRMPTCAHFTMRVHAHAAASPSRLPSLQAACLKACEASQQQAHKTGYQMHACICVCDTRPLQGSILAGRCVPSVHAFKGIPTGCAHGTLDTIGGRVQGVAGTVYNTTVRPHKHTHTHTRTHLLLVLGPCNSPQPLASSDASGPCKADKWTCVCACVCVSLYVYRYEWFLMSEGEKLWYWRNRMENERWFWEVFLWDRVLFRESMTTHTHTHTHIQTHTQTHTRTPHRSAHAGSPPAASMAAHLMQPVSMHVVAVDL